MPSRTRSRSKSPARKAGESSAGRKGRSRSKSPSRKVGASKSKSPTKRRSSSRARKSAPAEAAAAAAPSSQSKASTPKAKVRKSSSERPKSTQDVKSTPTRTQSKSVVYTPVTTATPGIRASARLADKVTTSQQVVVRTSKETVPMTVEKEMHVVLVFLQVLLLPLFVVWANRICTKESCEMLRVGKIPTLLSNYFDMKSSLAYAGFLVLQLVLMLPPIRVVRIGRNKYYCNGMLAVLVTLAIYGTLAYLKYPMTMAPPFTSIKFIAAGLLLSFTMAVAMFVKSRRAPAYARAQGGNTGNVLYDWYMGREVNPRNGRIDWKQYVIRVGLITWLLVNVSSLYKEVMLGKEQPNYVICYVTVCQMFYVLDAMWYENQMFGTATFKHQGLGLEVIMGLLVLVPHLNCVSTRYALIFRPEAKWFQLVGSAFVFFMGYFMYRGALSQMYSFKQGPVPAYMTSIQGSGGKRILTGGWWGIVRRPNYLGDLLMFIGFTLPCGFTNFFPWLCPVVVALVLLTRAKSDDRACRKRYGPAWEVYKSNTKYLLIPYLV